MANRIAGITVEIGGDMTKRSKALSSIAAGKRLPLAIRAPSFAAPGAIAFCTRSFEYFPSFFYFWAKEKAGVVELNQ